MDTARHWSIVVESCRDFPSGKSVLDHSSKGVLSVSSGKSVLDHSSKGLLSLLAWDLL